MLPDHVRRQRVRQGLGIERARGAAGLELGEEREADMLDQRVADAEPVEDLETLPAQTGLGGHPFEERQVEVEVQAVGRLLPPALQDRHARRYDRNLAAHDAGLARVPAVHAFPDVHRGAQADDDGVRGKGRDLDLAGGVPEAQRPNAAPTPAVARGNGLDGGDLGEVVNGRAGSAGAVVRRHPVTASFVGEHTLRIPRSIWASRKRGLPIWRY
jgi:hypothetical protein